MSNNIIINNPESKEIPGKWIVRFENTDDIPDYKNKKTPAALRILKCISEIISSKYSDKNFNGVITFKTLSLNYCYLDVVREEDNLKISSELSIELLWAEKDNQKIFLSEIFKKNKNKQHINLKLNTNALSLKLKQENKLVQFITIGSLFEKRDSNFSFVPPAPFYMSQSLLKSGFAIEVDNLDIETLNLESQNNFSTYHEKALSALKDILSKKPFCIAITAVDLYLEQLQWLLKKIRLTDQEVLIAVGGPLVTLFPEKAVVHLNEANIFLRGESDLAFNDTLLLIHNLFTKNYIINDLFSILQTFEGLLLSINDTLIVSSLEKKNIFHELNNVFADRIDLSFIKKKHILNGIFLNTSRGCPYHCKFCVKIHGYKVKQLGVDKIMLILDKYLLRLNEINKNEKLTSEEYNNALWISFTDDDFFINSKRAISILQQIKKTLFKIKNISGSLPSFFSIDNTQNISVLNSSIFSALEEINNKDLMVAIGTDDFSATEIKRLGKGYSGSYSISEIEKVISAFDNINIRNRHFLILSNPYTKWPDLFEKTIYIEKFSWKFNTFEPSPNPFILATSGTTFHSEILENNLTHRLVNKKFTIKGFDEFDHYTLNLIFPDLKTFSSKKRSCKYFFRRINDLIKTKYRYSILNEVFFHFFTTSGYREIKPENISEMKKCLGLITDGIEFRMELLQRLKEKPLSFKNATSEYIKKINIFLETVLGTVFIIDSLSEIFPDRLFQNEIETFKNKYPIENFYGILNGLDNYILAPGFTQNFLRDSINFSVDQILTRNKADQRLEARDISKSYIDIIYKKLCASGQQLKADEWMDFAKNSENLIELNILNNGSDFQFDTNNTQLNFLLEHFKIIESKSIDLNSVIVFLKAEAVFKKSLIENFLPYSEIRIPLYSKWLEIAPEFKIRFCSEFNIDYYPDNDQLIIAVISKFLAFKSTEIHSELLGTAIFNRYINTIENIIPEQILYFSEWMFGTKKFSKLLN